MTAAVLGAGVLVSLAALHRQLLVVGFDRSTARAIGGKPLLVDLALLALIAAATLIAVQGLGNLLVVAVLVAPAATARILTRRLAPMMLLSVLLAVGAAVGRSLPVVLREPGGGRLRRLRPRRRLSRRAGRHAASRRRPRCRPAPL